VCSPYRQLGGRHRVWGAKFMSMLERRSLLKLGLGAAAGAGLAASPLVGWAEPLTTSPMRSVSMQNLHTGETMEGVYWAQGDYVPEVLNAVNEHLRDYRTGDIYPIHPALLDLLDAVSTRTETNGAFQVISGYRSAKTNAMLRERSEEVAKKSFHIQGMAIDIRLPDVDLDRLHAAALSLGRGGVGYYPDSNFIHIDVGPVRNWRGA
jgi:uncharacterized protein YcbK (DUF882 family)